MPDVPQPRVLARTVVAEFLRRCAQGDVAADDIEVDGPAYSARAGCDVTVYRYPMDADVVLTLRLVASGTKLKRYAAEIFIDQWRLDGAYAQAAEASDPIARAVDEADRIMTIELHERRRALVERWAQPERGGLD